MSLIKLAAVLGALASSVSAHGILSEITIDGKTYQGTTAYKPNDVSIAWFDPGNTDTGFVGPDAFGTDDIICHKQATPGKTSAKASPGTKVGLKWNTWPDSHKGPIITYMAKCPGKCETVDKKSLKFFKIDELGPVASTGSGYAAGQWGTDDMIKNGFATSATIPKNLAPGNYVMRHEIIALHGADQPDGAQNYPQCINLEIDGSGTSQPEGVLATALYKPTDEGIACNIYRPDLGPTTYKIPGPPLCPGAMSQGQSGTGTGASSGGGGQYGAAAGAGPKYSNSTMPSSSSSKGKTPPSPKSPAANKQVQAAPTTVVQVASIPTPQPQPTPAQQIPDTPASSAASSAAPAAPTGALAGATVQTMSATQPAPAPAPATDDTFDGMMGKVKGMIQQWYSRHPDQSLHARDVRVRR